MSDLKHWKEFFNFNENISDDGWMGIEMCCLLALFLSLNERRKKEEKKISQHLINFNHHKTETYAVTLFYWKVSERDKGTVCGRPEERLSRRVSWKEIKSRASKRFDTNLKSCIVGRRCHRRVAEAAKKKFLVSKIFVLMVRRSAALLSEEKHSQKLAMNAQSVNLYIPIGVYSWRDIQIKHTTSQQIYKIRSMWSLTFYSPNAKTQHIPPQISILYITNFLLLKSGWFDSVRANLNNFSKISDP